MEGDTFTQTCHWVCSLVWEKNGSLWGLISQGCDPAPGLQWEPVLPRRAEPAILFWKGNRRVCHQLSTWAFLEVLGNEAIPPLPLSPSALCPLNQRTHSAAHPKDLQELCAWQTQRFSRICAALTEVPQRKRLRVSVWLISHLHNFLLKPLSLPRSQIQKHRVGFRNGLGKKNYKLWKE